ncbi:hypothetical protein, partial [Rothia nasimurium]|uniref:hypothetical protein n=1 Tax=Rothia nasimurium TaxID=85336 RepID=UPI001F1EB32F
ASTLREVREPKIKVLVFEQTGRAPCARSESGCGLMEHSWRRANLRYLVKVQFGSKHPARGARA